MNYFFSQISITYTIRKYQVLKMNPISSIYIPHVEKKYNAEFIAELFRKNGIAKVSKVAIEPYKTSYSSILKKGSAKYNHVYVEIKSWSESETAYNFIQRLKNPYREARIVYEDDFWWSVDINKFPEKLSAKCNKDRIVTIFEEIRVYECDIEDLSVNPSIDYQRTNLLKWLLIDLKRDDEPNDFNSYLREMHRDRELWFSEQYIFDQVMC